MKDTPYKAPDFHLPDADGALHTLADYAGNWLVLYFYPQDDTPGCTVEACSLRDANEKLEISGAKVVGISKDSVDSHGKFRAKYDLNFTLLSDENMETIKAYGAWGKKMYGREGVLRKTFVINPAGNVVKVYGRVTPLGHGEQVTKELARLQQA